MHDPIREEAKPHKKTPERILKLACIADILDYPDYALELLHYLTVNYGDNPQYNFANTIVDCLSQIPELVKQGLESLPVVATIRHRLEPL